MESGKEENYWPGFVDALSNVVLTLVFVLVIFVFALVMGAKKVETRVQAMIKAQETQAAGKIESPKQIISEQDLEKLRRELEEKNKELEQLRKLKGLSPMARKDGTVTDEPQALQLEDTTTIQSAKKNDKSGMIAAVRVTPSKDAITIYYDAQTVDLDTAAKQQLAKQIEAVRKRVGAGYKILLRAYMGGEAYSAAHRLAYYRAISVRNYLMAEEKESAANITANVIKPDTPEDGRVEIVFQKK